MAMKTREATLEELLDSLSLQLKYGYRLSYRHFVMETYSPRAANGVSHRQRSSSKVKLVDGAPHVNYGGKLAPITGTFCTLDNGKTFIADYRIKSEHLRANF